MCMSILFDQIVNFAWSDFIFYLIISYKTLTNDHIGGCRSNPPMLDPAIFPRYGTAPDSPLG